MRLLLEIIKITRETLSKDKEVFVRISATDNHVKGEKDESSGEYISWGIEQSKILLREMIKLGVTMLDVSTSGIDSNQSIKVGPGYQVSQGAAKSQILTCMLQLKDSSARSRSRLPRPSVSRWTRIIAFLSRRKLLARRQVDESADVFTYPASASSRTASRRKRFCKRVKLMS